MVMREGFRGTMNTEQTIFLPFGKNSVFASVSKVGATNFLKEVYNLPEWFSPGMKSGYQRSSKFHLYEINYSGIVLDLHGIRKKLKMMDNPKDFLRRFTATNVLYREFKYIYPLLSDAEILHKAYEYLDQENDYPNQRNVYMRHVNNYMKLNVTFTKEVILQGPISSDNIIPLGSVDLKDARYLSYRRATKFNEVPDLYIQDAFQPPSWLTG